MGIDVKDFHKEEIYRIALQNLLDTRFYLAIG
jgi:hypothetical protein